MIHHDEDEPPDLGPCCACGKSGPDVRNIMMLHVRAPVPGTGWGCFACKLPLNGAVAVLCDICLLTHAEPPIARSISCCPGSS